MKISCKHLEEYNTSWLTHFKRAIRWTWMLQRAAVCLAIHSIFPCYFESTASTLVFKIAMEMEDVIKEYSEKQK